MTQERIDVEGSGICIYRGRGAVSEVCPDLFRISALLGDFYMGTQALFGELKVG